MTRWTIWLLISRIRPRLLSITSDLTILISINSGLKFQELVFSNVSEAESALCSSRGSIGKRLAGKIKSLSFNATYKGKEGIAVVKVTPHIELP